MSSDQVNYLNIGLMLLSAGLAFVLPFELFLFSYAVLGPLHYLTEISWLHKRNYFTNAKSDYLWLVALCGLFLLLYFYLGSAYEGSFLNTVIGTPSKSVIKLLTPWANNLIFIAFLSALSMVLFKKWLSKILFITGVIIASLFIHNVKGYHLAIGIFLPTLAHVFLFTGAFILYGALKGRSVSGISSLVVFVLCSISFFVLQAQTGYQITPEVRENYMSSNFHVLNANVINLFKPGELNFHDVFASDLGLAVQQFIAFAYTYHYLNWFSKTSVIKWHNVPRKWLVMSGVIWIASVGLYYYDYKLGFITLLFMSMLHVILEFPLNYRTFMGIGSETAVLFSQKSKAPAPAPEVQ